MNTYSPKQFSIPPLTGISEKTMATHLSLYQGYVKHVNHILEKIEEYRADSDLPAQAGKNAYALGELQRRFAFEFDGMRNHEYYFGSLENGAVALADGSALRAAIERDFGIPFDTWMDQFKAIALIRGIGWAMLYFDPVAKRLLTQWVDEQHLGHLTGLSPIIALDVWEHAYLLDYAPAEKGKYIDAFFANINWNTVEKLFQDARKQG